MPKQDVLIGGMSLEKAWKYLTLIRAVHQLKLNWKRLTHIIHKHLKKIIDFYLLIARMND